MLFKFLSTPTEMKRMQFEWAVRQPGWQLWVPNPAQGDEGPILLTLHGHKLGPSSWSGHISFQIFVSKRTFELQHHEAVPINEVGLEEEKHRQTTESVQAPSSHTITSKEGWLKNLWSIWPASGRDKGPPATKTKTKIYSVNTKTLDAAEVFAGVFELGFFCQATDIWEEEENEVLQNHLDSAKRQVLRAESGHSDKRICKTHATAPSPSGCLSRSPVSP